MYKIIPCLCFFLLLQTQLKGQIVHIPDANFKATLLSLGTTIDANNDGEIQVSEAQAYTSTLYLNNKSISDLTGIQAFTALSQLYCSNNQLTNVDFSANTALTYLDCSANQLSSINLPTGATLQTFYCSGNVLTNLDVSMATGLAYFSCGSNLLTTLDLSGNSTLNSLVCDSNQLSTINLPINSSLTYIFCSNNPITTLDLSTSTALEHIVCNENLLSSVDLSSNTALRILGFSNNRLTSLDLSNNTALVNLHCDGNQLTHLDLSANDTLITLFCSNNQLTHLDLSANTYLRGLSCNYNQLTYLDLTKNTDLRAIWCIHNQLISINVSTNTNLHWSSYRYNDPLLQICLPNLINFPQGSYTKDPSATFVENCQYPLAVRGQIALDSNSNCMIDSLEQGLENVLVLFAKATDSSYALTNNLGYYLANLDTGTYSVSILHQHVYSISCPASQTITIDSNYQLQDLDFVLDKTIACPYLSVDISTPMLRRCFNSTYHVKYSNTGTTIANNAYIEVELDTNLYYVSSSIPLAHQQGNLYRFNVGQLPKNSTRQFSINVLVSCASQLGQYHCASAHIYPDSLCLTSLPNIQISDTCLTDSIAFTISNQADGVHLPYLLLEDSIVVDTGSFSLNTGQSISILYPTGGGSSTYQLVLAHGDPTHYAASAIVGCHPNAASSTLLHSPNLPQDFAAIDCTPNRGSYDPNDKTGYPIGYGNNHYINPNTSINYRIRFQNTGTDTAIFINILDTISPYLDLSSLSMGAVSHPYNLTMMPNTPSGEHVLRFEFDPIYLPDSNVNEPASHGFVHYSIAQLPNLPNGTIINNSASIYFDYNAPVQTNTTLHTVCDNCLPQNITNNAVVLSNLDKAASLYKVTAIPNPFSNQTRIELQGYTGFHQDLQLDVYDLMGRRQQQLTANEQAQFILHKKDLPTGIYFFQITEKGRLLQSGQLSIIK